MSRIRHLAKRRSDTIDYVAAKCKSIGVNPRAPSSARGASPCENGGEAIDIEGFGQRVLGAGGAGLLDHVGAAAGDDANAGSQALGTDFLDQLDAAAVWEHQVEKDPVGLLVCDAAGRVGQRRRLRHRITLSSQDRTDRPAGRLVVLHDQHGRLLLRLPLLLLLLGRRRGRRHRRGHGRRGHLVR